MKRNILLKFAAVMTAMALTCTGSWAATSGGLSPARRVATQQATVTETVPAAVASSATSSLPSSYDLRNVSGQSFVTSVKTQNFGDCWSFAASSAIESNLLKKGYGTYDLSEIQMSYFAYDDPIVSLPGLKGDKTRLLVDEDYSQFGGDYFTAGMSLIRGYGPTSEADAPYPDADSLDQTLPDSLAFSHNTVQIQNIDWVKMNKISAVKAKLMSSGAGDMGYYIYDDYRTNSNGDDSAYWNLDNNCYYINKAGYNRANSDGNYLALDGHEVCLVGWDDNFSRDNFGGTAGAKPPADGAWLCKNSWGTGMDECEDGYFWISYYDYYLYNVADSLDYVAFYDAVPISSAYDRIFQYDGTASDAKVRSFTSTAKTASVFTSDASRTLKAVGFTTYNNNLSYSVQIYKNPTNSSNPTSGTPMLSAPLKGSLQYQGFHTITIPSELATAGDGTAGISLNKGDKFSVVVTLTSNTGYRVSIPLDSSRTYQDIQYISHSVSGQSYYNLGRGWRDCSKSGHSNTRVKAYAE